MSKCLVTDLNAVVSKEGLPVYDSIRIKFNNEDGEQTDKNSSIVFVCLYEDGIEVTCEKGYLTDSTYKKNLGTHYKSAQGGIRLYVSKGAVISVKGKQKLEKISFNDGVGDDANKIINWDDLVYCKNLKQVLVSGDIQGAMQSIQGKLVYFSLTATSFVGTTDIIAGFCDKGITDLILKGASAVSGNITNFAEFSNLGRFYTQGSQIAGSVESLVEAMWKAGRRSGNLVIVTGSKVSFNDVFNGDYGYTIVCTFSESKVVCKDNKVEKTYDGTSWTSKDIR